MDKIFSCFVAFLAVVSSVAAEGFWNVRVNPQSVAVIPYHSSHVSVWEHASVRGRYFAAPLACLQPESAQHFDNFFTGKSQVNFRVLLWSREAKQVVYEYMRSRVNASILPDDVELLPMERIRLVWTDRQQPLPDYYQVGTEWRANSHLPTVVTFHIMCADEERCAALETGMKTTPEAFHGLHFEYEINAQKTATRRLVVKGEHLIGGQLYTRLVNMPVPSGVRYLSSQDVARLAAQTVTNVLTTVTTDSDYVDEEDEVSVTDMLRTVLQRQAVSTDTFTPRMWEMVFWSADVARPDKVARYLNQLLTEDATNTSRFLLNQGEWSAAAQASLGLLDLFSTSAGADSGTASAANKQDVVDEVHQRHSHVVWDGVRFTVKPMRLSRLNLATLNQSVTIAASQVQVRRHDSVKSIKLRARCGADNQTTRLTPGIVESRIERKLETITSKISQKLETVFNSTRNAESKLEQKLETIKSQISQKFDTVSNSTRNAESRLERKLETIKSQISQKFDTVSNSTRNAESRLERKLETVQNQLVNSARSTELRLESKLETIRSQLSEKLETAQHSTRNTESRLERKLETVQNTTRTTQSRLEQKMETVLHATLNTESHLENKLEMVTSQLGRNLETVRTSARNIDLRLTKLESALNSTRSTASQLGRRLENISNTVINMRRDLWPEYCYISRHYCSNSGPYRHEPSTPLTACRAMCSQEARCKAFNHHSDNNSCYLMDQACPPGKLRSDPDDRYYQKMARTLFSDEPVTLTDFIGIISAALGNGDPCKVLGSDFGRG